MFGPAVSRAGARCRVAAVVLVATILWVPVAVRAAHPVKGPVASSIRLNRGFDLPVDKQSVPAPELLVMFPAPLLVPEAPPAEAVGPVLEREHTVPDSPDHIAPDPLRGPPVSPLA